MKYIFLAFVAVCLYQPVSTYARMAGGSGVLLDVTSKKPIAGAKIRLECMRRLLHGSQNIKDIFATTDSLGRFNFESEQLLDCDFAHVHAEKNGYIETKTVDIRYFRTDFENLPDKVYMTPSGGARMQHLQFLSAMASGISPSKKDEYVNVFTQFFASTRIAETAEEMQYVRSQYCKRLLTLYSGLTDAEKSSLQQNSVQYAWNGRVNSGKVNHQEVESSCKSL